MTGHRNSICYFQSIFLWIVVISCNVRALLIPNKYVRFSTGQVLDQTASSRRSHVINMQGKGFQIKMPSFAFTGKLRPGTLSPKKTVPEGIIRPDYVLTGKPVRIESGMPWEIKAKTADEIEKMKIAGRYAREVLDEAIRVVKPGITTDFIDEVVHNATINRNCYPSTLNYHGFPKSCCTSINEVICHGIPDSTVLQDGDIVNIDVTVYHDGFHGDCSETVFVGNPSKEVRDLVITTYEAWQAAIRYCKPGMPYNGIGGIIEDLISAKGYTTVKNFCGHGIGRVFHSTPNVFHYKNNVRSGIMAPGHTFTIEPMICLGSNVPVRWPDKWTEATSDGLATAQFEHTLLITETGVEALTGKLPTSPKYSWE